MSNAHPRPQQSRKPEIEILPDGRVRYTRFYETPNSNQVIPEYFSDVAVGALDPVPLFTGARFTYQKLSVGPDAGGKSYLTRIFEQIPETAEVQDGKNTAIKLEDGRTGIEANFLQFSAASATPGTVGTTTAPGDASAFMNNETAEDDGTLRRIKRTYVYAGLLRQSDETKNQGKLLVRTVTSAKTVPVTPSGYTLITTSDAPVNGYPIYTYTFAKGDGLVSETIAARTDGLREVTDFSLGTKVTPAGIVIRDEYREDDGYRVFTVTTLQTAAGGSDLTTASLTYEDYRSFVYPGRAKPFLYLLDPTFPAIDVYQSPPVQTKVLATVAMTYQTADTIGVLAETLWNPSDWATMVVTYQRPGAGGSEPVLIARPLSGYRGESLTVAIDASPYSLARVFGEITFAMVLVDGSLITTPYDIVITIAGGPPNPDGNTYTLDAGIEPAFTAVDGTKWFRRTVITATIPAQVALPV